MKTRLIVSAVVVSILNLTLPVAGVALTSVPQAQATSSLLPTANQVSSVAHSSPVMFIENAGQFADGAHFQVRGGDRTIWPASVPLVCVSTNAMLK